MVPLIQILSLKKIKGALSEKNRDFLFPEKNQKVFTAKNFKIVKLWLKNTLKETKKNCKGKKWGKPQSPLHPHSSFFMNSWSPQLFNSSLIESIKHFFCFVVDTIVIFHLFIFFSFIIREIKNPGGNNKLEKNFQKALFFNRL